MQGQSYSELWGKNGEKWTPTSLLPDFSYAGYHSGEKAIAGTKQGAILIPAGRYLISDILWIKKPNIVLRGEGAQQTVLHFTRDLEDVLPNMGTTTSGKIASNYSWSGGFLWVKGRTKSETISAIVSENKRGDQQLELNKTSHHLPDQTLQGAFYGKRNERNCHE